jgi:hypothetical protein
MIRGINNEGDSMSTMDKKEALSFLNRVSHETGGPKDEPDIESDDNDSVTLADMEGASLRPANKNLVRLHLVLKDGKVRTMQYAHLDVHSTFEGGKFVLIFAGTRHYQVTIKGSGKKFWTAYDLCTLHRLPYIREATRQFSDNEEVIFSEIEIADITPEE